MKVTGLNHLTINVTDLEKSKAFYEQVLELEFAGFVDMGDHNLTYYQLPQGVRLELIAYDHPDEPVPVPSTHVGMYRHFALEVEDLDALKEVERRTAAFGTNVNMSCKWVEQLECHAVLITDPNGVEIEVICH